MVHASLDGLLDEDEEGWSSSGPDYSPPDATPGFFTKFKNSKSGKTLIFLYFIELHVCLQFKNNVNEYKKFSLNTCISSIF